MSSRSVVILGERARQITFRLADKAQGGPFNHHLEELDHAQHLSSEELKHWQQQKLHDLLCHAQDTTRFYRPLIPTHFSPTDSWEILSELPIISKQTIDADPSAFISKIFSPSRMYAGLTSGSTGRSFAFWMDRARRSRTLAELVYFGGWAGYEVGARHMFLRQTMPESTKNLLHRWPKNQILFDTSTLNATRLDAILKSLRDSHAKLLFAYPWTLEVLAAHCARQGNPRPLAALRSIIAFGGPLASRVRLCIEEALGCPIFERYSALEMGTIAAECEIHRLHLNVGSLYAELLPRNSNQISASGEPLNLVLTDLLNYAMPFLRYDMEDKAVLEDDPCPCGRSSPLIHTVYGRVVDQIRSPQGEWVDPFRIGNLLRDVASLRQFQFVQQTPNSYLVRVVPGNEFDSRTVSEIVLRYQDILGPSATIEVVAVDEIPALPSGKRPFVVSNLRRSSLDVGVSSPTT